MFESPETQPTGVTPAAAPSNPSVTASETPATDAAPATIDAREFEQSLKQFGHDWNLSNWKEKLSQSRKEYGKTGQELDMLRRKNQELEESYGPLHRTMNEVPGFKDGFAQYVNSFFQNQATEPTIPGYAPQYASPLQGFQDPVLQRVSQLENQNRINQLSADLNSIHSSGLPMDQDMADAILTRAQAPGYEKLTGRELYMSMYGEQALAHIEQAATKAAAAAIQKNNETYTPGPARGAAPASPGSERPDFSKMSAEQFNAWAVQNNERILAGFK